MSTLSYCTLTAYTLQAKHISSAETVYFLKKLCMPNDSSCLRISHTMYVLFIPHNYSTFQHKQGHLHSTVHMHQTPITRDYFFKLMCYTQMNKRQLSPLHTNTHAHNTHTSHTPHTHITYTIHHTHNTHAHTS